MNHFRGLLKLQAWDLAGCSQGLFGIFRIIFMDYKREFLEIFSRTIKTISVGVLGIMSEAY